ncbi:DUF429 domain-containing protein [Nonomuraea sp. B1E8]|uniref:DUF429 domain-containing protein n=1 Tax=unclassified Nonomuraea TaxID=2593643 RepID=UPI00325E66C1
MLTIGVDLAAEAARTAVAWLDWTGGRTRLVDVRTGADDGVIVEAAMEAGKAGIDCPLGWPDRFVDFVTAHRAGHVQVPDGLAGRAWRRDLAWRVTDQVVHARTGLTPTALGLATMPDGDQARAAATEGWIALPTTPLDRLVT